MTIAELVNNEKEIIELKNSISQLESSLSPNIINLNFITNHKINKIKDEIIKLDSVQETNIMIWLEENDKEYLALTNKSFDLLNNNKVEFKVYEEEGGMYSSHAIKMNGSLHNNGYVYTDTTKTNFDPTNIEQGVYPLEYTGVINYLGEMEIEVSKTGFEMFGGRMPDKFNGFIDNNGIIKIKTDHADWQITRVFYINKMVGDIFIGEHDKRAEFLENVHFIKNKIKEQREKLRGN